MSAVENLVNRLLQLGSLLASTDPSPAPLEDYVLEPAARWVTSRVAAGRSVPHNGAAEVALRRAITDLEVSVAIGASWVAPPGEMSP